MPHYIENARSPLQNVIRMFPPGDGKAVRHAFYNTVTLVFVALLGVTCASVYYILQAFLKPLVWAALVGTCLFPFKRALTVYIRKWLKSMDDSGKPLIVGAITFPIQCIDCIAESTTQRVLKYAKVAIFFIIVMPMAYLLYHYGPLMKLLQILKILIISLSKAIKVFKTYWVISIIVAYILLVIFYWTPSSRTWLKPLSIPVWIIVIIHLAAKSGALRVPIFILFVILMVTGAVTYAREQNQTIITREHLWAVWEFITRPLRWGSSSSNADDDDEEVEDTGALAEAENDEGIPVEGEAAHLLSSWNSSESEEQENRTLLREAIDAEVAVDGDSLTEPAVFEVSVPRVKRPYPLAQFDPAGEILNISTRGSRGEQETEEAPPMTWMQWLDSIFSSESEPSVGPVLTTPTPPPSPGGRRRGVRHSPTPKKNSAVRGAFACLVWAHVFVYSWSHPWLLHLIPLALILVGAKNLASSLGAGDALKRGMNAAWNWMDETVGDRKEALAPTPIRGLFRLALRGDRKIRHILDSCLDSIVSFLVIAGVIIGTIFFALFLAFQIQSETVHLVTMTSNVLNNTMQSEMFSYSWLPEPDYLKSIFDTMINNGYHYGREWISKKIGEIFSSSPNNKVKIEEQALELWDKLYQNVMYQNNTNGSLGLGQTHIVRSRSRSALPSSSSEVWEMLTTFDLLDVNKVVQFVRENLGLFSTVFDSVWGLLKSNINLCFSLITALISMIFGGGTVVLNFFVSSLIFLTTLFYLLAFSGDSYLPVQFVTSLTPAAESSPAIRSFYRAFEAAISGVFAATFKMALFYGLYTVLTHTLFGVNLVVMPSVMAALLGAVPFLGTYWAALPGVMELALVEREWGAALVLFLCHLLPTYLLDTAVYSEIKGAGHPYLTALAIAGGVYCLGLEGAIVGPILLCCLLVAVNLYSSILAARPNAGLTPTTPDRHARNLSLALLMRERMARNVQFSQPRTMAC